MTSHQLNDERFFSIRFWGVRGSIPVSGPATAEFGGATICHEIMLGNCRIIVDAGSGIRRLGLEMMKEGARETHILLSHLHLDHIIGLTAFAPFFRARLRNLALFAIPREISLRGSSAACLQRAVVSRPSRRAGVAAKICQLRGG